jgi:hypothetical protein
MTPTPPNITLEAPMKIVHRNDRFWAHKTESGSEWVTLCEDCDNSASMKESLRCGFPVCVQCATGEKMVSNPADQIIVRRRSPNNAAR